MKLKMLIAAVATIAALATAQSLVLKRSYTYPIEGIQGSTWINGIGGAREWMINDWNTRDFSGDGHSDILFFDRRGPEQYYIRILGDDLTELWNSYPAISWSQIVYDVTFVDFDGDGNKELVLNGDGNPSTLSIYSPSREMCILSSDLTSDHFFIVDFELDGLPDIVLERTVAPRTYEIWGAGTTTSSPPSDLTIHATGDDLLLNWRGVDSCSLYQIEWGLTLNGEYASVGTSCTPRFTHPGASILPRAYYRVKAVSSTWGEVEIGAATYVGRCR